MGYPFHKVLFIGPADQQGGMGAVLRSYAKSIKAFNVITTHDINNQQYFYFIIQFINIIKFILLNDDLEILHIHSASKGSFVRKGLVLLLAKAFNKKVVFHIHGGGFMDFYSSSKHAKPIIRWVLSKADVLICLSEEWKQIFEKEAFNRQVVRLNNPVQEFSFPPRNYDRSVLKILFLGRISAEKGLFDLLNYLKSNTHFRKGLITLTIGGTGDHEKLNALLNDDVFHDRVIYKGWLNENGKQRQLSDNDIFILPSYYEGMPISILEAMSAKMPIIATNVGGIPSVVKPGLNGWLFNPGSFSSLDSVFDDLMANKKYINAYGEQSLRLVQPYLADRIMQDLSEVYSTL
ncbi:MAG: hypothetical protein RLY85_1394 [Bacteroidota bacterium]|jgi:glycosyltransferase involved in cell wall biosynthesis